MTAATVTAPYVRAIRQHPRVEAALVGEIRSGTRALLAHAFDLSMDGLGVSDPAGALREGAEARVGIRIPGETREVVAPAKVTGRRGDRVGLTFLGLDLDDLLTLARYLSPRL